MCPGVRRVRAEEMCSSALLTFSLRVTSLRLQFGSDSLTATKYYLAVSAMLCAVSIWIYIYSDFFFDYVQVPTSTTCNR